MPGASLPALLYTCAACRLRSSACPALPAPLFRCLQIKVQQEVLARRRQGTWQAEVRERRAKASRYLNDPDFKKQVGCVVVVVVVLCGLGVCVVCGGGKGRGLVILPASVCVISCVVS